MFHRALDICPPSILDDDRAVVDWLCRYPFRFSAVEIGSHFWAAIDEARAQRPRETAA